MRLKGPIVTLVAGAAVAGVLFALDLRATGTRPAADRAASGERSPSATVSASPSAAASPSPSPSPAVPSPALPTGPPVTYAGYTTGGAATIAIAVTGGRAIAYLCDGRRVESWLQGTARNGTLSLTGSHNGSLTGQVANGVATGTVAAGGKQWTFRAPVAIPPSGLYRSSAEVRGAKIVAGWIVLPDGSQVGLLSRAGDPSGAGDPDTGTPAPRLDTATGAASLDGTPLDVTRVDGTTSLEG
jgi:hypothetical protein